MADKQTILATTIADALTVKLGPEFSALTRALAKMDITLNSIVARIEMMEQAASAGGTAPKKAVRTATKKVATEGEEKLPANALLFFRYTLEKDIDDARNTWCSNEQNMELADASPTVLKASKNKDKDDASLGAYYSAVGAFLWTNCLNDDDKKEIRAKFTAWKDSALQTGPPALEAE